MMMMMGLLEEDSILFVRHAFNQDRLNNKCITKEFKEPSYRALFLLSKNCDTYFFENIPKTFTISTKNSTLHFNPQMIADSSPVISSFIRDNPTKNNYFINITDDENILAKIEQLYQGKSIIFKEIDVPIIQRFTKILQMKCFPNYLKPKSLATEEIDSDGYYIDNIGYSGITSFFESNIEIYQNYFLNFLKRDDHQVFKIKTNKNEYACNIFAVYTSQVIRQILEKDPKVTEFSYNFEDKNDEFQLICDFFNYKQIDLENINIQSIRSIAEDLKIDCILHFIDNYNAHNSKFEKRIKKYEKIIDSIDHLFDLLNNIDKFGIEKVKYSIIESEWLKSDEKIDEFVAFILQVVKTSFENQRNICELINELDKDEENNNENEIKKLIPKLKKRLFTFYWPKKQTRDENKEEVNERERIKNERTMNNEETINLTNKCIYSFIRQLYKRGIISETELFEGLQYYDLSNNALNAFFLPELIKINPIDKFINMDRKKLRKTYSGHQHLITKRFMMNSLGLYYNWPKFVKKYLPDKIEMYERMLDKMEPDDEITMTIRRDDVDQLQRILINNNDQTLIETINYNIFDDFEEDIKLINYCALYGSVKCFKYLLLNNHNIDETTFYYSICGNNNEIIKIVDQQQKLKEDKNEEDRFILTNNIEYEFINQRQNAISFWFNFNDSPIKFNEFISVYTKTTSINDKYNDDNIQIKKYCDDGDYHYFLNYCNINNIIAPTIAKNQNKLFDFVFDNVFINKNKNGNDLKHIASLSASCGNVHSLLTIFRNEFYLTKDIISICAKNGFYSLTKLLLDLYYKETIIYEDTIILSDSFDCRSIVYFENLSIFKLFVDKMNQFDLTNAILEAIRKNCTEIIKYVFDNINTFDFILYDSNFISNALMSSLTTRTNELFDFLKDQFIKSNPDLFNFDLLSSLIVFSCLVSNFPVTKEITELILKKDVEFDFTKAFFNAASSNSTKICQYFLDKNVIINFEDISNISKIGAVDLEIFEKIINKVNPNNRFLFYECINSAIDNKNLKLIEYILQKNPPNNQELIEAVKTNDLEVVELILKYNSEPSFINQKTSNGTALCIAIQQRNLKLVQRLLSLDGINPNLYNSQNQTGLILAVKNLDYEIVNELLNFYKDKDNRIFTSLIINAIKYLMYYENKYIPDIAWQITKLLCQARPIDIFFQFKSDYAPQQPLLFIACYFNKIDVVETLINLDIDVNVYNALNFDTSLTISLEKNYLEIAKLLIKCPKTNINLRNIDGESALTIAAKNNQKEIIDLIINDERFDPIESKLNYTFIYANNEVSKQLYQLKSLDVNELVTVLSRYSRSFKPHKINALQHSVKINDIDKIDMIINHPSFNPIKSKINKSIFIATKMNNVTIFRKLIKLNNNDINIYNDHNEDLLSYASKHLSGDIIDEILTNEHFNSKNYLICIAFASSYSKHLFDEIQLNQEKTKNNSEFINDALSCGLNYAFNPICETNKNIINIESLPKKSSKIEIMEKLLKFDREHDNLINFGKLLPNGKSFFTTISSDYSDIGEVCEFLIREGADVNFIDRNGISPLEQSMKIKSIIMTRILIKSDRIKYSPLRHGNTYLHLASILNERTILEELLETKEFDINCSNEHGDTALILSTQSKNIENINLLFQYDELDYLHTNKDGKDALDVALNNSTAKLSLNELKSIRESREKYHNALISANDEMQNFDNH